MNIVLICYLSCVIYEYHIIYIEILASMNIIYVNCQGFKDSGKRKDVFNVLKSKNCNMYCLQDTHFTCEKENTVMSMWGF